jgi:phosphatidylinositol alpha-mannosyltransferase
VPNGVDVARFATAEPADLGPGPKVLFVGRLDERKGFRVAVDAFGRLAAVRPLLRLIVVGDGPERAAVGALPPEVRDRVRFLGTVPNAELHPVETACDLYVGPAIGGESFGVVLVEAMAAGLPVVASAIPGYDEVVTDGVEGLLVPPGDPAALAEAAGVVLDDPVRARALGIAGRARAASFDWAIVAGQLEALYAEAVAVRPSIR